MSKPYMISYDLSEPGQKYEDVFDAIKSFGSYINLQKSFWLVRSNLTPNQMSNKLENVIDENDSLFICELVDNYAGQADVGEKEREFIKKEIFKN
ncbi:hypothetical protein C7H83_10285 [Tetragenococcus halophilus]|uniref:Uncharacterized protein n=1 Tax=Tetragenococcus halophilus TaxID=51669 RepID=A0A3G5FKK3_TETHA|nr:hypothetical protein [Tetragenococcus halophilus]AYW50829.1 hypothetical protein C7H83_10285 [Tetragenococcus halophilus]GBD64913.1 hypothetical protein TEHD23766T_2340 [Tetragenococcus halophilus subsp. flandriensis]GMA08895.1 hypothetical protein GCM10025886_20460 [Tetragenococcus halophilus subsp. flandriensis]